MLSDVDFGRILDVTKLSKYRIVLAHRKSSRCELKMIDLLTNKVDLITYTDGEPTSICADLNIDNLYLSSEYGIEVFNLKTRNIYQLTMSNGNTGHIDGSLQIARFSPSPYDLMFLGENVILIADRGNFVLRVIDLVNKTVSTICKPGSSSAYGELTRDCHFGFSQSLLVLPNDDKILIGLSESIGSLRIEGELHVHVYIYIEWCKKNGTTFDEA